MSKGVSEVKDATAQPMADAHWHAMDAAQAAHQLAVNPRKGLDAAAAAKRLTQVGPNRLAEKPPLPLILLFINQFKGLLIGVLALASVVAAAIGHYTDAVVILVAVVLNATLGFVQEYRAEKSLAALKKMLALKSRVRRDGKIQEAPAEDLVPGDVVLLDAGDRVPADGRLVVTQSLEIDESAFTGESHPAPKQAGVVLDSKAALADRVNMAHMSSMVTRGRGEMTVTATGMATVMGKLSASLAETEQEPTPLQEQLDHLGKRLALLGLGAVSIIFALGLWRGEPLGSVLLEAIALAVATIPEGLPAVVTVTLALGMNRMAKNRAVVKRLAAVETLGCTTVICSDKTGTLTMNQMTARALVYQGQFLNVSGEGYKPEGEIARDDGGALPGLRPLLDALCLCNDSRVHEDHVVGDPMEGALLVLAAKGGVDRLAVDQAAPRVAEVPFDSAHKFMATWHRVGETVHVYMKGAPEVVLEHCSRWLGPQGESPLDATGRDRVLEHNAVLAARHLRVLAAATGTVPAAVFNPAADLFSAVRHLTFLGLVGLLDPPRQEAKYAIDMCKRAGIAVKMITGDQAGTASAIAGELGLTGRVVTGAELDQMSTEHLSDNIMDIAVFARVSPEHKLKIVQALKARGQVVAMTGDGVNDAPALKSAHIGVAMGIAGTEVSKEAATMVLTDDNFANIVRAVRAGRTIYDNIVKFVRFQLTTNVGAIITMLTASLLALPDPFNPIQILWVNIIMDGPPAMALGLEPSRSEIMLEKPRTPGAQILSGRRLVRIVALGLWMVLGTLAMLTYVGATGTQEQALTAAFTTFVYFQVFNVFNVRSERGSVFSRYFFTNRMFWIAVTAVAALQVVAVEWGPAQQVFHTTSLTGSQWVLAVATAFSILALDELGKAVSRWLNPRAFARGSSARPEEAESL